MNGNLFKIDMIGFIIFAAAAMLALSLRGNLLLAVAALSASALGFFFSALITSGRITSSKWQSVALAMSGFFAVVALFIFLLNGVISVGSL